MVKGAAIKFQSYEKTVPKILEVLNLQLELKKYDKIVLKVKLSNSIVDSTPKEFVEQIIKFCLKHKNPVADLFIAEGADGCDTIELFEEYGYESLAEKYQVSLIDLNCTETNELESPYFLKFNTIHYPKILSESLIISLTKLLEDEETGISGALSNMLGAFPSKQYSGFFSSSKNKIRKWPIKYSVHDILQCKMPNFAVVDASEKNIILAGIPYEIDKQYSKILEIDWQRIPYLNLLNEMMPEDKQNPNKIRAA